MVRTNRTFIEEEYESIDDILQSIGVINTSMEAFNTHESGIDGIGVISRDQDADDLLPNRLNLNGDFVLIGMERVYNEDEQPYPHIFSSIPEDKMSDVRMALIMTTYRNAIDALTKPIKRKKGKK